jgi:hypothetical protein
MTSEKAKPAPKTESKVDPVFGILGDLARDIAAGAANAQSRNVGAFFVEAIDHAAKGKKFKDFARYNIIIKE